MWKRLDRKNCYWEGHTKISLIKLHSSYKQEKEHMDHFHLPPKYIYLCVQPQTLHKSIRKESEAPPGNRNNKIGIKQAEWKFPGWKAPRAEILALHWLLWGRETGTRGGRWAVGREQGVWECCGNSAAVLRLSFPASARGCLQKPGQPHAGRFSILRSFRGEGNTTYCNYKPRDRAHQT